VPKWLGEFEKPLLLKLEFEGYLLFIFAEIIAYLGSRVVNIL